MSSKVSADLNKFIRAMTHLLTPYLDLPALEDNDTIMQDAHPLTPPITPPFGERDFPTIQEPSWPFGSQLTCSLRTGARAPL
jgi:hypothetical protein